MYGANTSDGVVELPEFLTVVLVDLSLGIEEPRGILEFRFLGGGQSIGLSVKEELPIPLGQPSITSARKQLDEASLVAIVGGGGRLSASLSRLAARCCGVGCVRCRLSASLSRLARSLCVCERRHMPH